VRQDGANPVKPSLVPRNLLILANLRSRREITNGVVSNIQKDFVMTATCGTCARTSFFHRHRFKVSLVPAGLIAGALIIASPTLAISQEAAPAPAQEAPLPLMSFTKTHSGTHSRRSTRRYSRHRHSARSSHHERVKEAEKTPDVAQPPEKADTLATDSGAAANPNAAKTVTAAAGTEAAFPTAANTQNNAPQGNTETTGSAAVENGAAFDALDATRNGQPAGAAPTQQAAGQTVEIVSPNEVNELDIAADKTTGQAALKSAMAANAAQPATPAGEQVAAAGSSGAMTSVQSSTVVPWLMENSWVGKVLLGVAALAMLMQIGFLMLRRRRTASF
jgi:hypothetical protein